MIHGSILDLIGDTPVVRFGRIGADLDAELFAKCEFLNPGGSLKDRVAIRMLDALRDSGDLSDGAAVVEPTSGNTGIGLAMACAVLGHPLTVTMSEKISLEKEWILKALGAEVRRTPNDAPHTSPESQLGLAQALTARTPGAVMPDQYSNEDNSASHYHGTGKEIWDDFGTDLDAVIVGIGTGGTIMGVARYLKEKNPDILVVGVEPEGSLLGTDRETSPYLVEGIGYEWIPDIFDAGIVDRFIAVDDADTFNMARRLIREEGLLVGGSSGAVALAMLEIAKELPSGAKVLGILPDGIRNYLTKFVSDDWMREQDLPVD